MSIINLFKVALRAIANNAFRSFLSMLGIIIGVAAVIVMMAIGQGSKESIRKNISQMGTNVIMIRPGADMMGGVRQDPSSMQTLKVADYEAILNEKKYVTFNKKNKTDFVLWFTKSKFEDQALKWDSPWGVGYPGWHIECSCISLKHLGEYIDLHCGGVDNIFPHHTNEIAQSEALIGHEWCKYWFHVNHLNDKSGKMSKSKGHFLTVSTLEEKGFNPLVYRMFCLQSHYRKPLEFSYEILENMKVAYQKLVKKVTSLDKNGDIDKEAFAKYKEQFIEALSNDINTSMALTVVYDLLKTDLNDATKYALIEDFDKVLSLDLTKEPTVEENSVDAELENYILEKIEERKAAKKAKDFAKADAIREELLSKGVSIKDTREGVVWEIV